MVLLLSLVWREGIALSVVLKMARVHHSIVNRQDDNGDNDRPIERMSKLRFHYEFACCSWCGRRRTCFV